MRYVYIKAGFDAVDQVRRLSSAQDLYRSGPDAYIGEFLEHRSGDDVLVLCRTDISEQFEFGRVVARSYKSDTRLSRLISSLQIGLAILRWRPNRILCGCTQELLWISVLAAKLLRVPIVNSRHGGLLPRTGAGSIVSVLDHVCIRACDAVVCNGPYTADQMRELRISDAKIFQFRVDLSSFAATGEASPPPKALADFVRTRDILMTFVGRVQRDKGVFDLLDAFRTLRASTAHLGLIYVGNGKDIEQLEREARASEVSADILFMGRVDHRQLSTVVRHSSVVVTPTHPSFPEGFPKTVLESLAVGVPVVAPRTGPFPYAIDHDRNGLLFEPGNPEDLLKCLGRIVKDTETLERLRRGALDTSRQLLERCMGFGEAVEVAFSTTARP